MPVISTEQPLALLRRSLSNLDAELLLFGHVLGLIGATTVTGHPPGKVQVATSGRNVDALAGKLANIHV